MPPYDWTSCASPIAKPFARSHSRARWWALPTVAWWDAVAMIAIAIGIGIEIEIESIANPKSIAIPIAIATQIKKCPNHRWWAVPTLRVRHYRGDLRLCVLPWFGLFRVRQRQRERVLAASTRRVGTAHRWGSDNDFDFDFDCDFDLEGTRHLPPAPFSARSFHASD
jgi:hypothetical protein